MGSKESKIKSRLLNLSKKYDKLIPNVDKGHLSYTFRLENSNVVHCQPDTQYSELAERLEEQLLLCGFPSLYVEMIMDRFVSGFSYEDLAEKYHLTSRHAARRYITKIIGEMRTNKSLYLILKQANVEFEEK